MAMLPGIKILCLIAHLKIALLSLVSVADASSLWEKSCPTDCSCTVEPWPYIQLDAKVMRCDNRSLDAPPKNLTSETEVLLLAHNAIGMSNDLNLYDFRYLQSLRFLDLSCNRIRFVHTHGIGFQQVRYLNLSHNDIHNLQTEVLADFTGLEYLNLEHNYLSSPTTAVFALPNLQYLNLGHNKIFSLRPNFYFNSPRLKTLILSDNYLTRLPDNILFRAPHLERIDLSSNRLSKIENLAFDGLRAVVELNLETNALRRIPTASLQVIPSIGHLILDRNPVRQLEQTSFRGVNVSHVRLCHADELNIVSERTFADMPHLTTVELCSNRALASIAPGAFVALPRLHTLDLRNNNLYVIEESIRSEKDDSVDLDEGETTVDTVPISSTASDEDVKLLPPVLPVADTPMPFNSGQTPLTLHVNGNPLICDCNLKWVQDILTRQYGHNVTVADGSAVKCLDRTKHLDAPPIGLLDMDDLPPQCAPFVLPLFQPIIRETVMASDVSFLCRGVGLPPPQVSWVLPDGRVLSSGMCEERACVSANHVLTVRYPHVQDSGLYECRAQNPLGEFKRSLHLEVDNVNVLLFPLTVTSTFVTLAWNASGLPPTEFQLQYEPSAGTASAKPTPPAAAVKTPLGTADDISRSGDNNDDDNTFGGPQQHRKVIEVGTKVHSYTVNALTPGETYIFWLCIKRADYAVRVSSVEIQTREEGFLLMLGIRRNYVSIILIGAAAGILLLGCTTLCCVKICRWARQDHSEMVMSESGSSRCFVKSDSCNSEVAFMTYINVADDTVLVENEDESPQ